MTIYRIFVLIIIITQNLTAFSLPTLNPLANSQVNEECDGISSKDTLEVVWNTLEPYQYTNITLGERITVTGMDIELINAVTKEMDLNINFKQETWLENQKDIKDGTGDITAGATYTDARAEYAYFSIPYRFEENSLFTTEYFANKIKFQNIKEFLAQIRLLNFRIGIIKGTVYGDLEITNFLNDIKNSDIVNKYQSTIESFNGFLKKEIDGFIADRIVGTAAILGNRETFQIKEVPLNLKVPIHLMFSKKTVSEDLVAQFNYGIQEFIATDKYKKIIKTYIYNILLPKSIDSNWCYIIGLIGSFAFAFSAIAIGFKGNSTLFGTFLFALLPSIGNCILLDLIVNNNSSNLILNLTPSYVYYIFMIVLISFTAIKLFDYYNKQLHEDNFVDKLCTNTIAICDALGQATFIVVGVIMVLVKRIEPLGFWGPFLAFMTSNCGVILRDFISGGRITNTAPKGISIEISILWGIIFSNLLDIYVYNPSYNTIQYSMLTVIAGAFVSNLLVYHFKLSNWTFRSEGTNKITNDDITT